MESLPFYFLFSSSPISSFITENDRGKENSSFCSTNTFLCKREKICIKVLLVCNNFKDCPDGSDEIDCSSVRDNFFECNSRGEKISIYMVCDHINHCSDGSDEIDCGKFILFIYLFIQFSFSKHKKKSKFKRFFFYF